MSAATVVRLDGLTIDFPAVGTATAVHDLGFSLGRGRTLGIVGESGSGKSLALRAIMGILPATARVLSGELVIGDDRVPLGGRHRAGTARRKLAMVFQDPHAALNPLMRVGDLIAEVPRRVLGRTAAESRATTLELMRRVHLPDPERLVRAYPHELSGGQRQRIMIAAALAGEPDVLLCDEPTTALDVTVQAAVLDLLAEVTERSGLATVFVSHDLAVVTRMADDVIVLRSGSVVERGSATDVLRAPREDYTRRLVAAVLELPLATDPRPQPDRLPAQDIPSADLRPLGAERRQRADDRSVTLEARGVGFSYRGAQRPALRGVDLAVQPGQIHGLVGESGSGKTTLARLFTGQLRADSGTLELDGAELGRKRTREQVRAVQMVFQDPHASLDPRMTVQQTLSEVLRVGGLRDRRALERRCRELLDLVSLPVGALDRVPAQFSGGQRQRIAIARALAAEPRVLVADEPTSALDVTVQAAILDLLRQLRDEQGLAVLLVSHNLAVVHEVCTEVSVIHDGEIVEAGPVASVLLHPAHEYTRRLVASVPRLKENVS